MKWFMELWNGSSDAVRWGLIVGLLVLAALIVWLIGPNGLQAFGDWLGAN